jgi:type IV pilus assembly protein PilE
MLMTLRNSSGGFTLIEVMIVVAIVVILLAVALPAYQNQIIRGHRAAAKAEMLKIGNREEQFLLSNRTYTATLGDISYTLPPDVAARYETPVITISATGYPTYLITVAPKGAQASDGTLTLNSEGVKLPADKWAR